jgi:hypothetical protein
MIKLRLEQQYFDEWLRAETDHERAEIYSQCKALEKVTGALNNMELGGKQDND